MGKNNSDLLTKQDWEKARQSFEVLIVNATINLQHYNVSLKNCEKRIAEFPEDEVEEIIEEVTKDA